MTKFMRFKEEREDAAGPIDVFVAETKDDGTITIHLWPRHDGSYVVIQGQDGVMGGGKKFAGPRRARAEFSKRIAEQVRYRSSPGQKFTSGDVQELANVSRQNLELRRSRGVIKGGTKTGKGYIYTAKEVADILSRPTLDRTNPPGDLQKVRRAYGNLYLRSLMTPRERQVIELRYPEPPDKPYSLDDVAETLHISRQRASELEHNALNRILKPSALDMELT